MAILFAGCASSVERPGLALGTGALTFRLLWEGPADLDLHVESPLGEKIDYMNRQVASGGTLDFDCNAHPKVACPDPVENVFWPEDGAPAGTYAYSVHLYRTHGAELPVRFRVVVMEKGRPVDSRRPEILEVKGRAGPWNFVHTPPTGQHGSPDVPGQGS